MWLTQTVIFESKKCPQDLVMENGSNQLKCINGVGWMDLRPQALIWHVLDDVGPTWDIA